MPEREQQVLNSGPPLLQEPHDGSRRPPDQARFEELVEGLDAIVAEYDARRCLFTYVSRRAEQLLGYPVENWHQSGFWESILHPEDRAQAVELCKVFTAQAVDHELEYRVVSTAGRVIWLREAARVLRDAQGKADRLFILFIDETARKRAEAVVEAQRRILEQVARGEPLGAIFGALMRVANELLPGASCAIWLGEHEHQMRVAATSEVNRHGADARQLTPSLPERPSGWSRPIRTAQGQLHGRLDVRIPDRREPHAEELQLLEVMTHLAVIAIERAEAQKALLQRAEALAEMDRRKNEFMAMLGHELRNPLAPMLTAVMLLPTAEASKRAKMCGVLSRQVKHMTRLVDDLLDVSRITRGKVRLCPESLVLEDVLQRALEGVRPLTQQHQHRVSVTLGSAMHLLQADPARLEQIFVNLLNNAAKFTPPGGDISVSVSSEGRRAVVSIRDSGIGIPAELLPHIFEPFRQGEQSLSRQYGGLGIGLTLVHELVSLHGGSVEARSEGRGRGSEFRVSLPVASRQEHSPEAKVADAPMPSPAARARQVLVVDDNVDAAETLMEFLQFRGHRVQLAHEGAGAIHQAILHQPELIVLDLGLPGLDGFQVAHRLRDEPRLAGATLVALTGYGQEQDRERARDVGIQHFLLKPVDLNELLRIVESG